jgi:hypothetical protein
MLVPIILFCVILSQTSVCDAIAKSNSIWSKVDHVSTIESDISSIRCCSHGHLMNSVKLTFKFLCMKSNHIKFYLSSCIIILVLNTTSSWLPENLYIPVIRVYLRYFSWISGYFSLISSFVSNNECEIHLSDKIITWMTAQETSLCLLVMFIWFVIISLILFTWICSLSSWNISRVNKYVVIYIYFNYLVNTICNIIIILL